MNYQYILTQGLNLFSTRELATIAWGIILAIFFASKKDIRDSFCHLFKILCKKIFIIIFIFLTLYLICSTYILYRADFWHFSLIKDTLFWFLFSGLSLCLSKVNDKDFFSNLKNMLLDNFKVFIILEFIVSNYTFNFWIEFVSIFFLSWTIMLNTYSAYYEEYKPVKKLTDNLLTFIGFGVFIIFLNIIKVHYIEIFTFETLRKLLLPVLYSVFFTIPAIGLKTYAAYENAFTRMGNRKDYSEEAKKHLKYSASLNFLLDFKQLNNLIDYINTSYDPLATKEDVDNFINIYIDRTKILQFDSNCIGFDIEKAKIFLAEEGLIIDNYKYINYDEGFGSYYNSTTKSFGLADTLSYAMEGTNKEVKRISLSFGEFLKKGEKPKNYKYFCKCAEKLFLTATNSKLPHKIISALRKRRSSNFKEKHFEIIFEAYSSHFTFSIKAKDSSIKKCPF